jgi:isoquinoline 1-oxidoreductase beta subunit
MNHLHTQDKNPADSIEVNLTRRGVLIGSALVGGTLLVGCSQADILSFGGKPQIGAFGPFIKIAPDGLVTVVSKHLEMGQGNQAGLAAMVAEELDADWSKITIETAPANAKLYGNASLNNLQGTGGSSAIPDSWLKMRKAGAAARAMFVEAAAKTWGVPAAEIIVANGLVSHASGKSAGFGDLIAVASTIKPPAEPKFKDPKAFTLIGTDRVRRKDSPSKSDGTARFTQDVHMPNMLVALVAHAPRFGAKVKSYDATDALKVPGVDRVVKVSTGVAVLATTTWAAKQGRDALKVVWDESKAETRSSDELLAEYKKIAAGGSTTIKAQTFETRGDVTKVAGEPIKFTYDFPYLAHATMEPMNCVAQVDGRNCKITTGSQIQTLDQLNAAMVVYTLPGAVEIETLFAGGSFGRRGNPTSDFVVECVEIAKQVGGNRPVKLVWTREDDMTIGRYRPMAHHAIEVKVDDEGYPTAWRHRVVTQSILKGVPGAPDFDLTTVEGALGSPYLKAIPNVDAQVYMPDVGVTVLWWRSVGATHTAMAMEHTIDQLAKRAGKDPVDYRRVLYARAGQEGARHATALNLAVEKSGYKTPLEAGWARGVAVHESFGSVVAQVAEVTVRNGQPYARRVVTAMDCGIAVAPDQVASQVEGATCYGLSAAMYGKITIKNGAAVETNFDSYRVLRHDEAPKVETYIVPSQAAPSGVGEPGTPVIAPAIANALLTLNGKATQSLPFVNT